MSEDSRNIVVSGCTIIFNGQVIGWTEDAVVLGYTHEDLVVNKVQQKPGVVKRVRINDDITIKMTIIESTLENLKMLLGITANITATSSLRTLLGDQSGNLPEGELVILGKGPNNVARTFTFYKAVLQDCGEINFDARDYTKIAVTFQVLWHASYSQRFKIEEEYIPNYPS